LGSPIVWQNVNLLGRFEFHKQQSVININEMICFHDKNRMATTESNQRSAGLKILASPFCDDSQKYPKSRTSLQLIGIAQLIVKLWRPNVECFESENKSDRKVIIELVYVVLKNQ
jgi:hypothetical protein